MSYSDSIAAIEEEWSLESGFLWKARQGQFDPVEFERTRKKLENIVINDSENVSRRMVSLLWYMPLFLNWQTERVREAGGDTDSYAQAVTSITNEIERILGTP
jgi:hypothetical protein